jgi:dTDP-4-dehydrorhamnose reductase
MIRLANEREEINVIDDQVGTPTNAGDLAQVILTILPSISNDTVEIFHFSNEGACSWYDFAKAIFEMKELNCKVNPIPTKMYPTPAKRPNYSLLSKSKIKETYKIEIPNWRDSLIGCIKKLQKE